MPTSTASSSECEARLDECRQALEAAREVRRLDRERLPEVIRPEVEDQVQHLLSVSLGDIEGHVRPEVQAQLESQIYALIEDVAGSYEDLREQNRATQEQLEGVSDALGELQHGMPRSGRVTAQVEEIQSYLLDWMHRHVDCRRCPERLKFRKKQRAALSKLETELTGKLGELRTVLAEAPVEEEISDWP